MEKFRTLLRKQGITIASILTALSMTFSKIVLAIRRVFSGGGKVPAASLPKYAGGFEKN